MSISIQNFLDLISVGGTILILIITGLSFWYQVLRTPRSDVGLSVVERTEPYSTDAGGITFYSSSIQIFNEGEMEALVDDVVVNSTLVESNTGEELTIPVDSSFDVSIDRSTIGNGGKLPPGNNDSIAVKIDINGLTNLPREFFINLSYTIQIRDNIRNYKLTASDRLEFHHERSYER